MNRVILIILLCVLQWTGFSQTLDSLSLELDRKIVPASTYSALLQVPYGPLVNNLKKSEEIYTQARIQYIKRDSILAGLAMKSTIIEYLSGDYEKSIEMLKKSLEIKMSCHPSLFTSPIVTPSP